MLYFTADWHLFHRNIITYCKRPFNDVHQMHREIVDSYKAVIQEDDTVYFVGDLTMMSSSGAEKVRALVEDLPGTKHLILGNHDKLRASQYLDMGFASVHTYLCFFAGGIKIHVAHDPAWAQKPDTHWVCGHVHNHWVSHRTASWIRLSNVGVDVRGFSPVSTKEVLHELGLNPDLPIKHL